MRERTIIKESSQGSCRISRLSRAGLLDSPETWKSLVDSISLEPNLSVLLDVSTLPKRVGLLLLRQLILNERVKDIVVCYVRAGSYREGHFVQDELPPVPLPGFGLMSSEPRESVFFVGVGYSTFDLRQVLQQTSSPNIHFLMPFPPASPSFRRTWKFLKTLNEEVESANPSIVRLSAIDMFSVYEWLVGNLDVGKNTTMLPLGPKPHGIAMALAQIGNDNCSELVYPQPRRYHPDYSTGVFIENDGKEGIMAYALRRDYKNVLSISH